MANLSCQPDIEEVKVGESSIIEKSDFSIFVETDLSLSLGEDVAVTLTPDDPDDTDDISDVVGEAVGFKEVQCEISIGPNAVGSYTVKINPDSGDPIEEKGAFSVERI